MASTTTKPIYPRPDFTRPAQSWLSLNGPWNFAFDDKNIGLQEKWYSLSSLPDACSITVPFAFQTKASGIHNSDAHEFIWYSRPLPTLLSSSALAKGDRQLVRFGAVDYECAVWVNGVPVSKHRGGHTPFDVDVTDALPKEGDATLTLWVRDSPGDLTQPRGKQYWKPKSESIWYTPTSGIWQNVWAEIVPGTGLGHSGEGFVLRGDDIENGTVKIRSPVVGRREDGLEIEVEVLLAGRSVGKARAGVDSVKGFAEISVGVASKGDNLGKAEVLKTARWSKGVALWSPESPTLYEIVVKLLTKTGSVIDIVETYVGLRSIDWKGNKFKLNGRPYFQALVLDQGYWPGTGLTPPSANALKQDIVFSKSMGFNGCRKHQKVEDPLFLYYADTMGFVVWGEMANAYEFDATYIDRFNEEWIDAVKRDINHPSILTWTPANETWGYPNLSTSIEEKNHLRAVYFLTRALDPTRPINDNCGWEHVQTDLITFHDYSDVTDITKRCSTVENIFKSHIDKQMFVRPVADAIGEERNSDPPIAPILCTEFGGLNISPAAGARAKEGDWGYITAENPNDLLKRLEGLCLGIVKGGHICGFVYTQLTDIEQEVNGLYTYDRQPKLEAAKVHAVLEMTKQWFYQHVEK